MKYLILSLIAALIFLLYTGRRKTNQKPNTVKVSEKQPNIGANCSEEPIKRVPQQQQINQIAARDAFLNNISLFSPLLSSLDNGSFGQKEVLSKWDDEIIDTNDFDLINLWKLVRSNGNSVKRIFAQWGLAPELCTEFECMDYHKSMYESVNEQPISVGVRYSVVSFPWILTSHDKSDKVVKTIVKKGQVK